MINLISLPSLPLKIIYILADKKKNILKKNNYMEPS